MKFMDKTVQSIAHTHTLTNTTIYFFESQGALKEGASTMEFMDKTVDVDKNAGIFVTLNPAGKGYGGRSKLPDNLKQLFR